MRTKKLLFCIKDIDYADHIAIAYLSSVAKDNNRNYHWDVHFCLLDDLPGTLNHFHPDVVAYSSNIATHRDIVNVNSSMKLIHKYTSILGGPQATFSPESFNDSGMDAYCVGEGDGAFGEFLMRIHTGDYYDDVSNLITPYRTNGLRKLIDLSTLRLPDRGLTLNNTWLKNSPKKTVYTSRGCPFKCNYCANDHYHNLYPNEPRVRRYPVGKIITEIMHLKVNYLLEFLKFGDDCFALKVDDWLMEFTDLYPKIINVPYNCFLRLDSIDEKLVRMLKLSGCYSVHLSVDSLSPHVREEILGRKFRKNNDEVGEVLRMLNLNGIRTWVNYMVAAPDSNVDDDVDTIDFSHKNKVTFSHYSTTIPMTGTSLYNYSVYHKLINENYHSDMSGMDKRSPMSCFSEKDKDIRYNVFLLGPIASSLPNPVRWLIKALIKHTHPNRVYEWINQWYYHFNITRNIFRVSNRKKFMKPRYG